MALPSGQEYNDGLNEAIKLFDTISQLIEATMKGKSRDFCCGVRDYINDNIHDVTSNIEVQ